MGAKEETIFFPLSGHKQVT